MILIVVASLARRGHFLRCVGEERWPDRTLASQYTFIHWLYQNVLYERLPVGRRRQMHQRIGVCKEKAYAARVHEIAAELALHFEHAQDMPRFIHYKQSAAENALRRYAWREAIMHLTQAIDVVRTLPDAPERIQQELLLQLILAVPLMQLKGNAAPEVEHAYQRAWQLCQQGQDPQFHFGTLAGLWGVAFCQGSMARARALAEQLWSLAQHRQEPSRLAWAHYMVGVTSCWAGELSAARAHLEQSLLLRSPEPAAGYVMHPKIVGAAHMASVLWALGYPDQARQYGQQALRLAEEIAHPYSLAFALTFTGRLHYLNYEVSELQERAEQLIGLADEHGFAQYKALGTMQRGWALVQARSHEEGLTLLHEGIAAFRATGAEMGLPIILALQAEAHATVGQMEEGACLLAEAETVIQHSGEEFYAPELLRLKGEILLRQEEGKREVKGQKSKVKSQKSKVKSQKSKCRTGGSLFSEGARYCTSSACEVGGAQSDTLSGSAVAAAGTNGRGPADCG